MRISRKYKVDDWKALSFTSEDEWHRGIAMFEDRIESRYLEHIRVLLNRPTSGFAVLALDCALIEALEQFRRGKGKTPSRDGERYFVSFLTEGAFGEHFDEPLAKLFYRTIRCGLLHQAEAESNSRVKRGSDIPLAGYTTDHRGIVINKDKFHELLASVVREYTDRLRNGESLSLREAFVRKMNYICRVESKPAEASGAI